MRTLGTNGESRPWVYRNEDNPELEIKGIEDPCLELTTCQRNPHPGPFMFGSRLNEEALPECQILCVQRSLLMCLCTV